MLFPNPAARVFKDDWEEMGKAEEFPYVGTTYRLTEHFTSGQNMRC